MLPKVSVFLIKKHYDTIENINFTKIKISTKGKKNYYFGFFKKRKRKMKLSYLNNKVIQNLNISTGITNHDRIFLISHTKIIYYRKYKKSKTNFELY